MTKDSAWGCGSDAENGYSPWCVKQAIVRSTMFYVERFFSVFSQNKDIFSYFL